MTKEVPVTGVGAVVDTHTGRFQDELTNNTTITNGS